LRGDFSISKGLSATHETYRRAMRGELICAQTLLDKLRQHVMQADDWLFGRTPRTAVFAKFERRGDQETLAALASFPESRPSGAARRTGRAGSWAAQATGGESPTQVRSQDKAETA
jgi:hypothetical protein